MKGVSIFSIVVSVLMIATIILCNPPLAEDDFMFFPPLKLGLLVLIVLIALISYFVIFIGGWKLLNYSRWGNLFVLLIVLVIVNASAINLVIKHGQVNTYLSYKEDHWDTWSWDLLPVYKYERILYFVPIIIGIIFLVICGFMRYVELFKYGCKLFPFLLCLQMIVIIYFSNIYRKEKQLFIHDIPIPEQYQKYIPIE